MKKLLLLLLVFPLVFTSCSNDDDDDDDEKAAKALVGTWIHAGDYGIVETNQTEVTAELKEELELGADKDFKLTFTDDGKFTIVDYISENTYTYRVKDNTIYVPAIDKEGVSKETKYATYAIGKGTLELYFDITEEAQELYDDYTNLIITKVISVETYTKE